jgi:PII-like signaling protein
MEIKGEASLLRIFVSSSDKFKHNPLYEMIVFAAKRSGLAGVTVIKGFMGYGANSAVHSVNAWDFSDKSPVVIEIVDELDKIDRFIEKILPWFEKLRHGYMITVEKANILVYRKNSKK